MTSALAIVDGFVGLGLGSKEWCPRWDSNPHALSDNGF